MANAEYTRKYGVPAPGAPKGKYPFTTYKVIQGGLQAVVNESEMTQIPPQYRAEGMEVFVLSTQKKYRLIDNPSTEYTNLKNWKYVPDGLTKEEVNKFVTNDELDTVLKKLKTDLKSTFLLRHDPNFVVLDAKTIAQHYQTIAGMSNYVSIDELHRIVIQLSKYVSYVVPLAILHIDKGIGIEDIELPSSVVVYFGDGSFSSVAVYWNTKTYDKDTIGYQILEGRLFLPDYIDADNVPGVRICHQIIHVKEPDELITNPKHNDIVGFEKPNAIVVNAGTSIRTLILPSLVTAKFVNEDGDIFTRELPVNWDYSQFYYDGFKHGVVLPGDIPTTPSDDFTNTLHLKPSIVIKVVNSEEELLFLYKRASTLPAGESTMKSSEYNRIDLISAADFYGCGNDLNQRLVDVRFIGILNDEGINITPQITDQYPDGIRMPVLNSTDEDVEAFLTTIRSFDDILGFKLEYEIPGCPSNPRIALDDETHRITFGSAVLHTCSFIIRKSATVNLPYPDIC